MCFLLLSGNLWELLQHPLSFQISRVKVLSIFEILFCHIFKKKYVWRERRGYKMHPNLRQIMPTGYGKKFMTKQNTTKAEKLNHAENRR